MIDKLINLVLVSTIKFYVIKLKSKSRRKNKKQRKKIIQEGNRFYIRVLGQLYVIL